MPPKRDRVHLRSAREDRGASYQVAVSPSSIVTCFLGAQARVYLNQEFSIVGPRYTAITAGISVHLLLLSDDREVVGDRGVSSPLVLPLRPEFNLPRIPGDSNFHNTA